ncbi:hypothetical protein HJD18_03690 [Thermoleophilia bacterium SCSIO 60948]|nr:hypothetical protein HJD18_03690 [Thermoleophilia bacterium SCSIO 60948]
MSQVSTPFQELLEEAEAVGPEEAAPPVLRGPDLVRTWDRFAGVGALAGFAIVSAAVALLAIDRAAPGYTVLAMALAGAAGGVCLGAGQAFVLRRALPMLGAAGWVRTTALGATLALVIVALPLAEGLADGRRGLDGAETAAFAVACVALPLLIGGAQWLELREALSRSPAWIAINVVAWAVGLAVMIAVALTLWGSDLGLAISILLAGAASLAAAAGVTVVTGLGLSAMLRADDRDRERQREDYVAETTWLLRTVAEAKKRARRERLRSLARRGL